VLFDPTGDFVIGSTGCDHGLEFVGTDTGFSEELLIHWATESVIAFDAEEGSAAFIEGPSCHFKVAEFQMGRTRFFLAQVFSEFFEFRSIDIHIFTLVCESIAISVKAISPDRGI
jgi:hypothetical protein